jgi:hypothetical protein
VAEQPKPNARAAELAELAAPYAKDVVDTLVQVMRNPRSRQRLAAAQQLAELMTAVPIADSPTAPTGPRLVSKEEAIKIWREAQEAKRSA